MLFPDKFNENKVGRFPKALDELITGMELKLKSKD
jgi:hypothetical protein